MDDLTDKLVNGKPPLPPQRAKNKHESAAVLTPLIDEMIPPRVDVRETRLNEGTLSRDITPRPGGFIKKLVVADDEDKSFDCVNFDETVIKESTPYIGPPSYPVNDILDSDVHGWSPELQRVLSVVVSTVMLLAHGESSCPPENLQWTYDFLLNVKDNNNQTPPNTRWLLNYIRNIKKTK